MRLTTALLMGVLLSHAASPSFLATLEASSSALPQAQTADKKALTVEQVVSKLEAQWDSMELGEEQRDKDYPTGAEVAKTESELGSRLKAQPQDTQTLLLWARFALIPYYYKLGTGYKPSASKTESLPPGIALDRVLAAEPHNAEALYLKGRIYGGAVRAGNVGTKRIGLGQAIPLLRQAVEFAPDNLRYREFLALFLADQGHPGEGKEILHSAQKNHPMIVLLEDLESVSAPEGGQFFVSHPISLATMEAMMEAAVADHLHLRLRTYQYAKSRAEIEAFYANRIPGFRFIPEKEDQPGAPRTEDEVGLMHLQFLRVKSGKMEPSRQRSEVPDPDKAKDGIMMTLLEMDNPDRRLPPDEHGCYLILANYRK